MSKLIILIAISLLFFLYKDHIKKLEVISKATAIKVYPGYALKQDDSTFSYHGSKYFIITNEVFNNKGDIVRASVAGDVGYSTYTQRDFEKYKSLVNDYAFTKHIKVQLISYKSVVVNDHKVIPAEIDRVNKAIYYKLKSRDTLYRIIYK